jgi:DNA-directed RNA polymerase specialized sigma24 family protein
MPSFDRLPIWWDREIDDETGRPIRGDVREAGHQIWTWLCIKTRYALGEENDASELLEKSVKAVSRYLDKNKVPDYSNDLRGLLMLACHRSLRRLTWRRNRTDLVGEGGELAEMLRAPDWRQEMDRQLFLQELARHLNTESRFILRLRMVGYDWKEIARMLGNKPGAVRQRFWREVRRAHLTLVGSTNPKKLEERK